MIQIGFDDLENEIAGPHTRLLHRLDRGAHAKRRVIDRRRHEVDEIKAVGRLAGGGPGGEAARVRVEGADFVAGAGRFDNFSSVVNAAVAKADETFVRDDPHGGVFREFGEFDDGLKPSDELVFGESAAEPGIFEPAPPVVQQVDGGELPGGAAQHADSFALGFGEHFAQQSDDLGVALQPANREKVQLPFESDVVLPEHAGEEIAEVRGGGEDFGDSIECRLARCAVCAGRSQVVLSAECGRDFRRDAEKPRNRLLTRAAQKRHAHSKNFPSRDRKGVGFKVGFSAACQGREKGVAAAPVETFRGAAPGEPPDRRLQPKLAALQSRRTKR